MELQFLGTGAGVPSKMRNVTSIALKLLDEINEVWLFDCGEATQQQILNNKYSSRKNQEDFHYTYARRSYLWVTWTTD